MISSVIIQGSSQLSFIIERTTESSQLTAVSIELPFRLLAFSFDFSFLTFNFLQRRFYVYSRNSEKGKRIWA